MREFHCKECGAVHSVKSMKEDAPECCGVRTELDWMNIRPLINDANGTKKNLQEYKLKKDTSVSGC